MVHANADFNGEWVLDSTVGLDGFLLALDVGWLKRTAAETFINTLNGKAKQRFCLVGDELSVNSYGPNNPDGVETTFVVGDYTAAPTTITQLHTTTQLHNPPELSPQRDFWRHLLSKGIPHHTLQLDFCGYL